MAAKNIAGEVEAILQPILSTHSLSLYDVQFLKEGPNWYLRVFIDKEGEGGVSINDCENVSRGLEAVLDEKDFIEQQYILEVSSPGVERALKKDVDFARFAGTTVDVKLYKPKDGKKVFRGELVGLEDGVISIIYEGETVSFEKAEVALCKTVFFF